MLKIIKNTLISSILLAVMLLSLPVIVSANIPAGCEDVMGPPYPGTICPDGTILLRDGNLPLGCPGSSQQGPVTSDHTVVCPARPGRSECTYSQATGECLTAGGVDVIRGDALASGNAGGNNPSRGANLEADCKEDTNKNGTALDKDDCGIIGYVITFTNILSGLVGVVIVIMIAIGGVQYSSARDDPQAVASAKQKIQNAILALVFYLFAFAFLQWIIPGGIF